MSEIQPRLTTDLQLYEIVESKGFHISRNVFIYNTCQAKTACMMHSSNPEFTVFMPCTLSVYEEYGKTAIFNNKYGANAPNG